MEDNSFEKSARDVPQSSDRWPRTDSYTARSYDEPAYLHPQQCPGSQGGRRYGQAFPTSGGRYLPPRTRLGLHILPLSVQQCDTRRAPGYRTADFELGPDSKSSSGSLCLTDTLDDPLGVALPVESPLVEGARGMSVCIRVRIGRYIPSCEGDKTTHYGQRCAN
jgi:hypothetical protein